MRVSQVRLIIRLYCKFSVCFMAFDTLFWVRREAATLVTLAPRRDNYNTQSPLKTPYSGHPSQKHGLPRHKPNSTSVSHETAINLTNNPAKKNKKTGRQIDGNLSWHACASQSNTFLSIWRFLAISPYGWNACTTRNHTSCLLLEQLFLECLPEDIRIQLSLTQRSNSTTN